MRTNKQLLCTLVILLVATMLSAYRCSYKIGQVRTGEEAHFPTPLSTTVKRATSSSEDATPQLTPGSQRSYKKVEDIVNMGDLKVVVLGWSILQTKDRFKQPAAGHKYIAVDVLLVNTSKDTGYDISPYAQMSLTDKDNYMYSASRTSRLPGLAGFIAPGERIRGSVVFEVSRSAKGLAFVFSTEVFGGTDEVSIALGQKPSTIHHVPAKLPGEGVHTYKTKDTVRIDNLEFIVDDTLSPPGDQFTKPKAGYKFILIDLTIKNLGGTDDFISPLNQMVLKEESGRQYNISETATLAVSKHPFTRSIFSHGEKVRGQVGYQVPQEAKGLVFVFSHSTPQGMKKVFVKLS